MADDFDDDDDLEPKVSTGSQRSPTTKKAFELVVSNGKEAYSAFVAKDRVESFVVRCADSNRYRIFNHRLNQVQLYGENNSSLTLKTSDGVIQLLGRNLDAIDEALALRTCASITEYSADRFLLPTDKNKAFVEHVLVLLPPPPETKPRLGKPELVKDAEKEPEDA